MVSAPNKSPLRSCPFFTPASACSTLGSQQRLRLTFVLSPSRRVALPPYGYYKGIQATIVDGLPRAEVALENPNGRVRDLSAVTEIYNEVLRTSTAIYRMKRRH
jgi:hypothetical protein